MNAERYSESAVRSLIESAHPPAVSELTQMERRRLAELETRLAFAEGAAIFWTDISNRYRRRSRIWIAVSVALAWIVFALAVSR